MNILKNNVLKWFIISSFVLVVFLIAEGCSGRSKNNFRKTYDTQLITRCNRLFQPDLQGYGAKGRYSLDADTITNRMWPGERHAITVFLPRDTKGKRPTIFFSHAYGATDWQKSYFGLINNFVSHGYIVVYVPYSTFGVSTDERYETLWQGFMDAAKKYAHQMDLSRVGFVGHSFGGGATPAMAYKGFVENGWGAQGRLIFIMAPWYSYQISNQQMRRFPSNTKMIIQVYDADTVNDHRMAIDLFNTIAIRSSEKKYLLVHSQSYQDCQITADHRTPGLNPFIGLKSWGVSRYLNAAADYTFTGNKKAAKIFHGSGSEYTMNMGQWTDGSTYTATDFLNNPKPYQSESYYKFPWTSHKFNKRLFLDQETQIQEKQEKRRRPLKKLREQWKNRNNQQ